MSILITENYTDDLEVAVLLLAKREGPDWTYDNIVNGGLIKMVDDSSYPSTFNALSLLGEYLNTNFGFSGIHSNKMCNFY